MRRTRTLLAAITVVAAVGAAAGLATAQESSTSNGITRIELAETQPANGPGQTLYLQEVRIAPGAQLPLHLHQGTQVASIRAGVLTYDIKTGTATVTRADGTTEEFTGPTTIKLRRGDAITETETLVHFGSNAGKKPVVIMVAALLADGAPLATPVEE
jgi:hypothetical protein